MKDHGSLSLSHRVQLADQGFACASYWRARKSQQLHLAFTVGIFPTVRTCASDREQQFLDWVPYIRNTGRLRAGDVLTYDFRDAYGPAASTMYIGQVTQVGGEYSKILATCLVDRYLNVHAQQLVDGMWNLWDRDCASEDAEVHVQLPSHYWRFNLAEMILSAYSYASLGSSGGTN